MSENKTIYDAVIPRWCKAWGTYHFQGLGDVERTCAKYKADYNANKEGDCSVGGVVTLKPTKGEIAHGFRNCIVHRLEEAVVKQLSRNDFVTTIHLLICARRDNGRNLSIKLSEGIDISAEGMDVSLEVKSILISESDFERS